MNLDAILIHGTPGLEQMSVERAMKIHSELIKQISSAMRAVWGSTSAQSVRPESIPHPVRIRQAQASHPRHHSLSLAEPCETERRAPSRGPQRDGRREASRGDVAQ